MLSATHGASHEGRGVTPMHGTEASGALRTCQAPTPAPPGPVPPGPAPPRPTPSHLQLGHIGCEAHQLQQVSRKAEGLGEIDSGVNSTSSTEEL